MKTTKVKVTLELEIPDRNYAEEAMHQLVFDNFVRFSAGSHIQEAIKWEVAKSENGDKDGFKQEIIDTHCQWSEILAKAGQSFKVEV